MSPNQPTGDATLSEEDVVAVRKVVDDAFRTAVECEQGDAEVNILEIAGEPDDEFTAPEGVEGPVDNGDIPSQPEGVMAPPMTDCANALEVSGAVDELDWTVEKEIAPVEEVVASDSAGAVVTVPETAEGVVPADDESKDMAPSEDVAALAGECKGERGLVEGDGPRSAEADLLEQLVKTDEMDVGTEEVEALAEEGVGENANIMNEVVAVEDSEVPDIVRDADEPDEKISPPEAVATELVDAEEVTGNTAAPKAGDAGAAADVLEAEHTVDDVVHPDDGVVNCLVDDGAVEDAGHIVDASSEPGLATTDAEQPTETVGKESLGCDAVIEEDMDKSDGAAADPARVPTEAISVPVVEAPATAEGTAAPTANGKEMSCGVEKKDGLVSNAEADAANASSNDGCSQGSKLATECSEEAELQDEKMPRLDNVEHGKHNAQPMASPKSPPIKEGASKRRRARMPVKGFTPSPSPPPRPPRGEQGRSSSNNSPSRNGVPRFMQSTAAFKGKGGLQSKSKEGSKPAWVSTTTSRQDAGYQTSMQLKVSQINVGMEQNGGSRSVTPTRDPHVPRFMQATHSVVGKYGGESEGSTGRKTPGSGRKHRAPRDQSTPVPFY